MSQNIEMYLQKEFLGLLTRIHPQFKTKSKKLEQHLLSFASLFIFVTFDIYQEIETQNNQEIETQNNENIRVI